MHAFDDILKHMRSVSFNCYKGNSVPPIMIWGWRGKKIAILLPNKDI